MSDLIERRKDADRGIMLWPKETIELIDELERLTATTDEQHLALKELAQDNDKYKDRIAKLEKINYCLTRDNIEQANKLAALPEDE